MKGVTDPGKIGCGLIATIIGREPLFA